MSDVLEDTNGTRITFRNGFAGPLPIERCIEILASRGFSVHIGRGPDFMGIAGGGNSVVSVVCAPDGEKYVLCYGEPLKVIDVPGLLAKGLTHFIFDHVDLEAT